MQNVTAGWPDFSDWRRSLHEPKTMRMTKRIPSWKSRRLC